MSKNRKDLNDMDVAMVLAGGALAGLFVAATAVWAKNAKPVEYKFTVVATREGLTEPATGQKYDVVEWINDKGETGVAKLSRNKTHSELFKAFQPGKTYRQTVGFGRLTSKFVEIAEGPYVAMPKQKVNIAPKPKR